MKAPDWILAIVMSVCIIALTIAAIEYAKVKAKVSCPTINQDSLKKGVWM